MIYASLNIAFAIITPILAHTLFPQPFVYVREDEIFTGTPWSLILGTNRNLGLWMTFQTDTARGTMLGLGILTLAVVMKGLKNGQEWALTSILLSGIAGGFPFWTITALYIQRGLYLGASGLSLGLWLTLLIYLPWAVGLILARKGIQDQEKAGSKPS